MTSLRDRLKHTTARLKSRSKPSEPPEDSVWLRFLAQLLVGVGIVATDIAAETSLWVWAIPVSFIGAFWSYRQRTKRNIGTQFLLAIGMLVALMFFFVVAIARREQNDLRVVLVGLLVQIQVLHSFDLPRRKDLGYSMMIGLILLGVASTLSQTMAFGGMLLIFLAIALPVLILDYRSRLGITSRFKLKNLPSRQIIQQNSLKLLALFALTLALGLGIFAFMPRLPGYQLRTLPMSAPIDVPGKFDNRTIANSGYGSGSTQGDRPGRRRGTAPSTGEGQADEEFYSGFGDRINQNLRGQLKPRVVMRVRSQAEGFWRMQAFDRYTGQGWELSDNEKTQTINRSGWAQQFYLPVNLNRAKVKTKEVIQTYNIIADLPNLIPTLADPKELFFPTQQIAVDSQGSMRSPVPLADGLTYTVISDVPYRDRTALQSARSVAPKTFLPSQSLGQPLPKSLPKPYTSLPSESVTKILRRESDRLLATSPRPITSDYERALYLTQTLKQRYTIQPELPFFGKDEDLAEAFLTKYKGGYPDHFSTTLTAMLRSIGMSTRLVTGFMPGRFNSFTGLYEVSNTDAYAMTEVYFESYGWFGFDPIPGHPLIPPSIEEDQTFTVLKQFWNWVASWLPSPVMGLFERLFGGVWQRASEAIGWFLGLLVQGVIGWLTAALVLTGVGFGLWLLWGQLQRWRYVRRLQKLPQMERLYQQMSDWLTQQGVPCQTAWTPFEYSRVVQSKLPHAQSVVNNIVQAYVQWRYGGKAGDVETLGRSFQLLKRQRRKPEIY